MGDAHFVKRMPSNREVRPLIVPSQMYPFEVWVIDVRYPVSPLSRIRQAV